MTDREMFDNLQKYAISHYEEDGWDTVVECVDFSDFVEEKKRYSLDTWEKVFQHYEEGNKIYNDYRKDIEATAF